MISSSAWWPNESCLEAGAPLRRGDQPAGLGLRLDPAAGNGESNPSSSGDTLSRCRILADDESRLQFGAQLEAEQARSQLPVPKSLHGMVESEPLEFGHRHRFLGHGCLAAPLHPSYVGELGRIQVCRWPSHQGSNQALKPEGSISERSQFLLGWRWALASRVMAAVLRWARSEGPKLATNSMADESVASSRGVPR